MPPRACCAKCGDRGGALGQECAETGKTRCHQLWQSGISSSSAVTLTLAADTLATSVSLAARASVAGDLVVHEALLAQASLGAQQERGLAIFVGQHSQAATNQLGPRRVGLDRQRVDRHVLDPELEQEVIKVIKALAEEILATLDRFLPRIFPATESPSRWI